jgi:hypothetical protein
MVWYETAKVCAPRYEYIWVSNTEDKSDRFLTKTCKDAACGECILMCVGRPLYWSHPTAADIEEFGIGRLTRKQLLQISILKR